MVTITLNLNGGYLAYSANDVPYDIEPGRGWYLVESGVYEIILEPPASIGGYSIELPIIRMDGGYIAEYAFNYGNYKAGEFQAKVTKGTGDKSEETFFLEDAYVDCSIYPIWSENTIDYPFVVNLDGGTDVTYGRSSSYWSNLTLKYGESVTLPTLTKSGYKYQGWDVTPVKLANDTNYNTGVYNSSSKKFTQYYGLYTATPIFVVDSGEDGISGSVKAYSNDYVFKDPRAYRAAIGYDLIISNTEVKINWTAYVQMKNGYQWGVGITCEGQTSTGALVTSPGTTYKTVTSISGTKTVQRSSTSTTTSLTARAYGTSAKGSDGVTYGGASGSIDLTVDINIPALDNNRDLIIYGCINSPIYNLLEIGETRSIKLQSSVQPEEQFYVVNRIKVYLSEDDYVLDNLIDDIEVDGEHIENEDRGLFTYSYNPQTNILTYTQGSQDIILLITWRQPIIGDAQSVYVYLKKGVIYAQNFISSQQLFIDKQGSVHAPSFKVGDKISFDKEGIIATDFMVGLPK